MDVTTTNATTSQLRAGALARPYLIVITGPPCTGKTTLGRWLASELGLPFFYKDQFKEILYDHLGIPDLEASRTFGGISFTILQEITSVLLSHGIHHIVEANFSPSLVSEYFANLESTYEVRLCEIHLRCAGEVLIERFLERSRSGDIHPGHQGEKYFKAVTAQLLQGDIGVLAENSKKLFYDTTSFETLDYGLIFRGVESWLAETSQESEL